MRVHSADRSCRLPRLFVLACVPLLLASPAHAENEWEFSAGLGFHLFSGNNELGAFEVPQALSPNHSVVIGLRLGRAITSMLGVELELGALPTTIPDSDASLFASTYRLHGVWHFAEPKAKLRPFAVAGFGLMNGASSDQELIYNDTDPVWHLGGGAKYRLGDSWGVRGDLRGLLPPSSGSSAVVFDFEMLVSAYFTFPGKPKPKDSDSDGILDRDDKCPKRGEDIDNFQDDDGCPEPDNDKDGIADGADRCPNKAEDRDEYEDKDGCPDPDNDSDGIDDSDDKCPGEPEDMDQFEDDDGCPENDNDQDGFVDGIDSCPNEAEDKDNHEDDDGCPDPDNDGDGVLDGDDSCPDELETKNGYEDADGCPDTIPRKLKRFTGVIKGITFKTDSDEIRKQSFRTLNAAIKVLQDYPQLRISISGHTDNTGDADHNRDLSQRRAQSVKNYMVEKGIDESRLVAEGFGPDRPIADNGSRKGRARNRRVEFKLLSALTQGDEP